MNKLFSYARVGLVAALLAFGWAALATGKTAPGPVKYFGDEFAAAQQALQSKPEEPMPPTF